LLTVVPENVICAPSSALDKQQFEKYFGIRFTGTSFQAFDMNFTNIDADALFVLPVAINI
jgi:hypothetical protein